MDYIFIPSGQRVSVADGKTLPPALYRPADKPKRRRTTRKAAPKEV